MPYDFNMVAGFFSEFSKIAEDQSHAAVPSGIAGLAAGGAIGGTAGQMMGANLLKDVARTPQVTDPVMAEKLRAALSPKTPLQMSPATPISELRFVPPEGPAPARTGSLFPSDAAIKAHAKGGTAVSSSRVGPHFAAHELGHARLWGKSPGLRKALMASRLLAPLSALGATVGAAYTDTEGTASKLMPLAGLAGTAPVMADEAYASLKGYGALKKLKPGSQALRTARRQLGKAFGTYGLTFGATAMLAPYLTRKAKQWHQRRFEE